jgi:hypothetical protein
LARAYELELQRERLVLRRGAAVRRLREILGLGDAWSLINEADRQWRAGNRGWAVELEEAKER